MWKTEKKERKNNIVIKGLVVRSNAIKSEITEFMRKDLEVEVRVEDAFEVGRETKLVVVKMGSWEDKKKVLMNKKKLGVRRVYIEHDLTRNEREIQNELI